MKKYLFILLFFLWLSGFLIVWTSNAYIKIGPYDLITYITDTSFDTRLQKILEIDQEKFQKREITIEVPHFVSFTDTIENLPIRSIKPRLSTKSFEQFTLSPYHTFLSIWNENIYFVPDIQYDIFFDEKELLTYLEKKVTPETFPLAYTKSFVIDKNLWLVSVLSQSGNIINWDTNKKYPYFSIEVKSEKSPQKITLNSNLPNEEISLDGIISIKNNIEDFYKKYNPQILNSQGYMKIEVGNTTILERYTPEYFSKWIEIINTEDLFKYKENSSIFFYNRLIQQDKNLGETYKKETIELENTTVKTKNYKKITLKDLQEKLKNIKKDDIFRSQTIKIDSSYDIESTNYVYKKEYKLETTQVDFCNYLDSIDGESIIQTEYTNQDMSILTFILEDNNVFFEPEIIYGTFWKKRQDFLIDYRNQEVSFKQKNWDLVCKDNIISFLSQEYFPQKEYFWDVYPLESYIYIHNTYKNVYKGIK